jgi:hypothetical protein
MPFLPTFVQYIDIAQLYLVFFGGVVIRELFSANKMIKCVMRCNVPLSKHDQSFGTPCMEMGGLSGNIP